MKFRNKMSAELISGLTSRGVVVHLEANFVSLSMNTANLNDLMQAIYTATSCKEEKVIEPRSFKNMFDLPPLNIKSSPRHNVSISPTMSTLSSSITQNGVKTSSKHTSIINTNQNDIKSSSNSAIKVSPKHTSISTNQNDVKSSSNSAVKVSSTIGTTNQKSSFNSAVKTSPKHASNSNNTKRDSATVRRRKQRQKAQEMQVASLVEEKDEEYTLDKLSLVEIKAKRTHIRMKDPLLIAYPDIKDGLLLSLIQQYDANFFNGKLTSLLAEKKLTLIPRWSKSLTKCVSTLNLGSNNIGSNTIVYFISRPLLMGITADNAAVTLVNTCISVADRMDALMQVIEHDLIHIYEYVAHDIIMDDTHSKLFERIAANLFGHVRSTHVLFNTTAKCDKKSSHLDFKTGQRVFFMNAQDERVEATVITSGVKDVCIITDSTKKQIHMSYQRLYPLTTHK